MKRLFIFLFVVFTFLITPRIVLAQSFYVLPYPGIMPGNKLYYMQELFDSLKGLYSFGDFAQFKYNLSESDKKLVEAKTLFEYGQYPLALRALEKSDNYYRSSYPHLISATRHKKNIKEKLLVYHAASIKHREVLLELAREVPDTFTWMDEKKDPVLLKIKDALLNSAELRLKNI